MSRAAHPQTSADFGCTQLRQVRALLGRAYSKSDPKDQPVHGHSRHSPSKLSSYRLGRLYASTGRFTKVGVEGSGLHSSS